MQSLPFAARILRFSGRPVLRNPSSHILVSELSWVLFELRPTIMAKKGKGWAVQILLLLIPILGLTYTEIVFNNNLQQQKRLWTSDQNRNVYQIGEKEPESPWKILMPVQPLKAWWDLVEKNQINCMCSDTIDNWAPNSSKYFLSSMQYNSHYISGAVMIL